MLIDTLKILAAVGTILTGLVSVFWPRRVLGFTGLEVSGGRGITEIRTVLGAVFVGIGAAVLFLNAPEAYQALGITYLVMAVVRAVSMFWDRSAVRSNVISFAVEAVVGIVLVL